MRAFLNPCPLKGLFQVQKMGHVFWSSFIMTILINYSRYHVRLQELVEDGGGQTGRHGGTLPRGSFRRCVGQGGGGFFDQRRGHKGGMQ